jgi:hypothetical protein
MLRWEICRNSSKMTLRSLHSPGAAPNKTDAGMGGSILADNADTAQLPASRGQLEESPGS